MLWHIVDRVSRIPSVDQTVVAVPDGPADEPLRRFCHENRILYYAGSETDVLDRFYQAACRFGGDPVLRITADCPLIDPSLIQRVIDEYDTGGYDHVGVATGAGAVGLQEGRFPDGLDGECFSFAALERAWREATDPRDREHVTRYIWKNRDLFRCGDFKSDRNYGPLRLTVDHREDFYLVTKIYEALYSPIRPFSFEEVVRFLDDNAELAEVNQSLTEKMNYREVAEN
jgi:spore coat polysaccharide biosynthesis protein SpsF